MKIDSKKVMGEFAIIVLGVLMALWVDAGRQGISDRQTETAYIESLATDLRSDLAEIDSATAWTHRFEAAAATVLAFLDGVTTDPDELVIAVQLAGWQYPPAFSTHTIDDLRSTGNLRLLRSEELKRAMSAYYLSLERYERLRQPLIDRVWEEYDARVGEVLSPGQRVQTLIKEFGPHPMDPRIQWSDTQPAEIRRAFLEDRSLVTALGNVVYAAVEHRGYLAQIRAGALSTLGLAEAELAH